MDRARANRPRLRASVGQGGGYIQQHPGEPKHSPIEPSPARNGLWRASAMGLSIAACRGPVSRKSARRGGCRAFRPAWREHRSVPLNEMWVNPLGRLCETE